MNNQSLKGRTTMLRQVSDEVRLQDDGNCFAHAMATAVRATIKWINKNCNIIIPEIPHHELLPECTLAYYGRGSSQGKKVRKERGEKTMNNIHSENISRTEKAKLIFNSVVDVFGPSGTGQGFTRWRINSLLNKYGIDRIQTKDKNLVIEHLQAGKGANAIIGIDLTPKIADSFERILFATTRDNIHGSDETLSSVAGYNNPNFVIEKEHLTEKQLTTQNQTAMSCARPGLEPNTEWWRHEMTIAGYNLDPSTNQETGHTPPPYWIIKNSWGTSIVDGGYFRLAMNAFEDCDGGVDDSFLQRMYENKREECKVEFEIYKPSDLLFEICKNQIDSITEPFFQTGEYEEEGETYSSFGWGGKRRKRRKTKTRKRKRKRKQTIKKKRRRGRKSRKR